MKSHSRTNIATMDKDARRIHQNEIIYDKIRDIESKRMKVNGKTASLKMKSMFVPGSNLRVRKWEMVTS